MGSDRPSALRSALRGLVAQLLRDFMRDFVAQQQEAVDHDAWFRRQVQTGLDSANAGNLVANEDVEAEFASRRTATRRKLQAKA